MYVCLKPEETHKQDDEQEVLMTKEGKASSLILFGMVLATHGDS